MRYYIYQQEIVSLKKFISSFKLKQDMIILRHSLIHNFFIFVVTFGYGFVYSFQVNGNYEV